MGFATAIWDLDDDPKGNVQHIAEHDVAKEEVEEVLRDPSGIESSRSSGYPIAFGETSTGRLIAVVFEEINEEKANREVVKTQFLKWRNCRQKRRRVIAFGVAELHDACQR